MSWGPSTAPGDRVPPRESPIVKCPICLSDHDGNVRYCSHCGSRLRAPCAACGHPNPPETRFCLQCGSEVEGFREDEEDHGVGEARFADAELRLERLGRTPEEQRGPSPELKTAMERIRKIARSQSGYRPRYSRLRGTYQQLTRRPRRAVASWNTALASKLGDVFA